MKVRTKEVCYIDGVHHNVGDVFEYNHSTAVIYEYDVNGSIVKENGKPKVIGTRPFPSHLEKVEEPKVISEHLFPSHPEK